MAKMAEPDALQKILQRLIKEGTRSSKIPPCPECGRAVKLGCEFKSNGVAGSAAIWLWCSSCIQAAVAFGVSPPPPWLKVPGEKGQDVSGAG
ncbi:MAG TPA: hypothetical protein VI643_02625 [Planctomycetota bacterium]|nr:hypothetical protein [Planctomycetota bacterium]